MHRLHLFGLAYAAISALIFRAFAAVMAVMSDIMLVAFPPGPLIERHRRELTEREVVAPLRARQRSFLARLLSTVDFRLQPADVAPRHC